MRASFTQTLSRSVGGQSRIYKQLRAMRPAAWYQPEQLISSAGLISQATDISGNGRNTTQATGGKQPVLTRSDTKENRLYASELFSNSTYWLQTGNVAITADQVAAPDGTTTADKIADDTANGQHYTRVTDSYRPTYVNGKTYVAHIYAQAGTKAKLKLFAGHTSYRTASFNLTLGTVIAEVDSTGAIEDVGGGWWRCSMTFTAAGSGLGPFNVYLLKDDTAADSYIGTGTYLYVWGGQLREAGTATTYVSSTTYPQYAGINGRATLMFDGVDDSLVSAAVTAQAQPVTHVMVLRPNAVPGANQIIVDGIDGTNRQAIYQLATTGNMAIFANGPADSALPTGTAPLIVTAIFNGSSSRVRLNGTQSAALNPDTGKTGGWRIGSIYDGSVNFYAGRYAEHLIFFGALTASELATVEKYLGSKYAITVA